MLLILLQFTEHLEIKPAEMYFVFACVRWQAPGHSDRLYVATIAVHMHRRPSDISSRVRRSLFTASVQCGIAHAARR